MDYPAKIILFGEYGILLNSQSLAIPYSRFSGRLRLPELSTVNPSQDGANSNGAMAKLNHYFKAHSEEFKFLDITHFEYDLKNGLYFDSTIPSGSGLGSSGALSAAIFDRYSIASRPQIDLLLVKSYLAAIESCFHGVSSGIDPFISWIKKPVHFGNTRVPDIRVDLSPFFNVYSLFLINSHSPGNTGALVNHFMEKYQQADFKEIIDHQYIPVINQTIDALLAADFSTFENLLARYSQIQLTNFQMMIPEKMRNFFRASIESRHFYLKICGSGGGGYFIGISRERTKTEAYFNLNQLDYTIV